MGVEKTSEGLQAIQWFRQGKLLGLMGAEPADGARAKPILEQLCRRLEHGGRIVGDAVDRERDLAPQQVHPGALELVQWSRLRRGQQSQRRIGRAGLVLGLCSGQRALPPAGRAGRQPGGLLQEGGRRGQTTARLGAAGRALEL